MLINTLNKIFKEFLKTCICCCSIDGSRYSHLEKSVFYLIVTIGDILPMISAESVLSTLISILLSDGFFTWSWMRETQQKLTYARIMLQQAKQNSNDYSVFMANLDAFVTDARSVTLIMQKEFNSVIGFKEWYNAKQQEIKNNSDFVFFNKLRVDTIHVRPFNTSSKYITSFPEEMTISGGKTVDIPLGKVDHMGNLVIDNTTPVSINGNFLSTSDIAWMFGGPLYGGLWAKYLASIQCE